MKDPQVSGIGRNTYKTAAECTATYFKPLATGDAYDGKFLQVAEPPAELSDAKVNIAQPQPDPANLKFVGVEVSADTLALQGMTARGSFGTNAFPVKPKESWQDLVDSHLLTDPEAIAAFEGTESLPFKAGKYNRIAVKVIDPRGNEVMAIRRLDEGG